MLIAKVEYPESIIKLWLCFNSLNKQKIGKNMNNTTLTITTIINDSIWKKKMSSTLLKFEDNQFIALVYVLFFIVSHYSSKLYENKRRNRKKKKIHFIDHFIICRLRFGGERKSKKEKVKKKKRKT